MREVGGHVFDIFDEYSLFLNKEVGVLSHALINIIFLFIWIDNHSFSEKILILKSLVVFFEIQKLGLDIKGSHFDLN